MREQTADPVFQRRQRAASRVLLTIRGIFLITMVAAVMLAILQGGAGNADDRSISFFVQWWWIPLLVAVFLAVSAISLDAMTPTKKLSGMTAILFGLIAGLLATVAISFLIDLLVATQDVGEDAAFNRIVNAIKAACAITLCYLGVSVVYSTQDEFRLVIPYVEFSKQLRGTHPLILDTSAIIDGRINEIGHTGFIAAPIIIPRFVINELQALSDSGDRLKRSRGRRGLDMIRTMQDNPHLDLSISDIPMPGLGVDQMLVEMAKDQRAHLVTTDLNLNKVASIHGVKVLNVNDLANALKPVAIPGEKMTVEIVKRGEGETQGVGYLQDGTMVVVEEAVDHIGRTVRCTVTSSIQTTAGRMIFGVREREEGEAEALADSSTSAVRPGGSEATVGAGGDGTTAVASDGSAPGGERAAATSAAGSSGPPASRPVPSEDEAPVASERERSAAASGASRPHDESRRPRRSRRNPRRRT